MAMLNVVVHLKFLAILLFSSLSERIEADFVELTLSTDK